MATSHSAVPPGQALCPLPIGILAIGCRRNVSDCSKSAALSASSGQLGWAKVSCVGWLKKGSLAVPD